MASNISTPPLFASWPRTALPDASEEQAYQLHFRSRDALITCIAMGIALVVPLLFVKNDFTLLDRTSLLILVVVLRAVQSAITIGAIILCTRRLKPATMDNLRFAWVITFIVTASLITLSRPPTYSHHVVLEVFILFSIYLLVPNRYLYQLISGSLYTAALLMIIFTQKSPSSAMLFVTTVTLVITNLTGAWLAWSGHISRRSQFILLQRERQLNAELKEAKNALYSLEGLLPICAACKKIRSEDNAWHEVAEYIHDHSGARFSHSICPDCSRQLYPDLQGDEE